jgi:hypothetical protein
VNGVLSVTKARVAGVDRDRTKTREDRRVVLCPRARCVLQRQLALRTRLQRAGLLDHERLFCHPDGQPIRRLSEVYARWRSTLKHLAIRYRKPYAARHSSVSWNLMIGRNPLFVAHQHGHGILTMLSVYAAWTEGSLPADVTAIRRAMRGPATHTAKTHSTSLSTARDARVVSRPASTPVSSDSTRAQETPMRTALPKTSRRRDLAIDLPVEKAYLSVSPWKHNTRNGGAGGSSVTLQVNEKTPVLADFVFAFPLKYPQKRLAFGSSPRNSTDSRGT